MAAFHITHITLQFIYLSGNLETDQNIHVLLGILECIYSSNMQNDKEWLTKHCSEQEMNAVPALLVESVVLLWWKVRNEAIA